MKDPAHLTPAEYEIMHHLWDSRRPLPVGEVLRRLTRKPRPAYTTVMTILDKMARKGSVRRVKRGKAYFYSPAVAREEALQRVVGELIQNYFGGELQALRSFLEKNPRQDRVRTEPLPEEDMDVVLL